MPSITIVDRAVATGTSAAVACAPAGWYDVDNARRRWFDGREWTDYYAPVVAENSAGKRRRRPADHGFHLIMTVMTLCAWLPVWAVAAGWSAARRAPRRMIRP